MNHSRQSSRLLIAFSVALLLVTLVLVWFHSQSAKTPREEQVNYPLGNAEPAGQLPEPAAETPAAATNSDVVDTVNWRTVQVCVQDKAQQPVALATVQVDCEYKLNGLVRPWKESLTADDRGCVQVKFPPVFAWSLKLHARDDSAGLGGKSVRWNSPEEVPASYTITLARTTGFGGTVVDEAGRSIAGAVIRTYRSFWSAIENNKREEGEYCDLPGDTTATDASGNWVVRDIALALIDTVGFEVSHSEYISRSYNPHRDEAMLQALQRGDFQIVMRRGSVIQIFVYNEVGAPLPEAEVEAGAVTRKTDAAGKVGFGLLGNGKVQINVKARGYLPETRSVTDHSETEEIVFQMKPGQLIRGWVQNEAGEPLRDVHVTVGLRYGPYSPPAFSSHTDAAGHFEWDAAPASPQRFDFRLARYSTLTNVLLEAVVDNIVTLKQRRRFEGRVINAATGEAVTQFRISLGASDSYSPFRWGGESLGSPEGQFTMVEYADGCDLIRAESDGFEAQIQKILPGGAKEPIVFHLKPVPPVPVVRGLVVSPEGVPLAGVQVVRVRPSAPPIRFGRRQFFGGSANSVVKTDASGQFAYPTFQSSGLLLAANPLGFGQAPLSEVQAGRAIVLQPYGQIKGKLTEGPRPAPRQWVAFRSKIPALEMDFFGYCERTDEDGDFTIAMLPPGQGVVLGLGPDGSDEGDEFPVTVRAGEATHIELQP